MIQAKVIADSTHHTRLTTLQLTYPRFIHSELMTHRTFSRNAASSRAIPVEKMIAQVRDNPAMPIYWGANKPGMQASSEVQDTYRAQQIWVAAANDAANRANQMMVMGLHKQVANRTLEPYQTMVSIVSATDWDNFFELRLHPDAQPEIQALAKVMANAMDESTPQHLAEGEWHLPYVQTGELHLDQETLKRSSAARCARVSYLTHDGQTPEIGKDLTLFERLAGSRPIHASPLEHVATPATGRFGNFHGWKQFRQEVEAGL